MFEPGDRVRIIEDNDDKVWIVLGYPYKLWHDQGVTVGDAEGRNRAVLVSLLEKVEEDHSGGCNDDFCEIIREEMRLE